MSHVSPEQGDNLQETAEDLRVPLLEPRLAPGTSHVHESLSARQDGRKAAPTTADAAQHVASSTTSTQPAPGYPVTMPTSYLAMPPNPVPSAPANGYPAMPDFPWPRVEESSSALARAVEDVNVFWQQMRPLMILWLFVSSTSFLLFMLMDMVGTGFFMMAELAAILALVPPLCYLFPCLAGGLDMAAQVKLTLLLGKVSGALDFVTLLMVDLMLLSLVGDCTDGDPEWDAPEDAVPCGSIWALITFFTLVLGGHAWLCFQMSKHAQSAQLLLNPVSSGLVSV